MSKNCEYCKKNKPVSYISEYDAFLCEDCYCQQEKIDDFEICPKCLTPYDSEDFITVYESVPYGSTTASFPVDFGVKCHNCGYKEQI